MQAMIRSMWIQSTRGHLPCARTATSPITPMPAHPTATMDLAGSLAESLSASDRGAMAITDSTVDAASTGDAVMAAAATTVTGRAIPHAEAIAVGTVTPVVADRPLAEADVPSVEMVMPTVGADLASVEADMPSVEAREVSVETHVASAAADAPLVETHAALVEAGMPLVAAHAALVEADMPPVEVDMALAEAEAEVVRMVVGTGRLPH